MQIEFQARYPVMDQEEEIDSSAKLLRNLGIGDDQESNQATIHFEYQPTVIEMNDIKILHGYDKYHSVARLYDGDLYILKVKYPLFKILYEHSTGKSIRNVKDFQFEEVLGATAKEIKDILKSKKNPPEPLPFADE